MYKNMTVADLKRLLQDLPDDMEIMVDGYEGDVDYIEGLGIVQVAKKIKKDSYTGGYCCYELEYMTEEGECEETTKRVLLFSRDSMVSPNFYADSVAVLYNKEPNND